MSITISSFTISPSSVIGDNGLVTATLTLSSAAPNGISAALSYSTATGNVTNNLPILNLPPTLDVEAGQTVGTITFTTNAVNYQWPGNPTATVTASLFDGTTLSNASATLTVTSYGTGQAPGFPVPACVGTGIVGYPVPAQPPNTQQSGNYSVGMAQGPAVPNSNGNQSGTSIAMQKLNALNIGTNPPPKDGR